MKSSGLPVRYFIRDDDVGALTDELRSFVEIFVTRRIPVSYQIIPALFTEECAGFLVEAQVSHPDLIEFGQHGLNHEMVVGGRRLYREFGPERSLAEQRSDIAEGLALMKSRLGAERGITIFTPPQHKYDHHTPVAAADAGHRIFSAACYPTFLHRSAYAIGRGLGRSSFRHHGISHHGARRPEADITELSIAIPVDDGGRIRCSAKSLPSALTRAERYTNIVGLMFHHAVYGDKKRRDDLLSIADGLSQLGEEKFCLLGGTVV